MKFTPVSAVQAIMLAKRIASRVDPGFASVDIPTFGRGAPVERANSGLTNGGYAAGGSPDGESNGTAGFFSSQAGELSDGRGISGSGGLLQAPDGQRGSPPLEGLPQQVKIPATGQVISAGPALHVRNAAASYMQSRGLPYRPPTKYVKVDPERAAMIAKAYEEMPHDPEHPLVKASYDALIDEVTAQYQHAKAHGLKVDFWDPDTQEDPYAASPRLANEDIRHNNHMFVFPTSHGYGQEGFADEDVKHNPMLRDTGERWGGKPVLANDLFRVVHDYFGHAKEGLGFREHGEENAWLQHAAMFSPLARIALTGETRGQNSHVNYGPHGEHNRSANSLETRYAPQKTGAIAPWVLHSGVEDQMEPGDIQQIHDLYAAHGHGKAEGGEVDAINTDDEGKTVPESAKTLEHQRQLLLEGRRKAVMYPAGGHEPPEAPDGAGETVTPDGTFHFNPALVTEEQIHEASRQHRLNEVLGLGPYSKQDIAKRIIQGEHPVAVVARDSDGHEVISAAGTHATAAEQIEAMRHQVPEGGSIGIEHPEQVIRDRQAVHRASGGEVGDSNYLNSAGLYSAAGAAADSLKQAKGRPQDMLRAISTSPGVKADEFKWSGANEAFLNHPTVTKEDLSQYFHSRAPNFPEKVYRQKPLLPNQTRVLDGPDWDLPDFDDDGVVIDPTEPSEPSERPSSYHDYTIPGGENYREVLMHLPDPEKRRATAAERRRGYAFSNTGGTDAIDRQGFVKPVEQYYKSSHWSQPNVVVHLRMSDRQTPEGKKALHLEELQSDWGQDARKKGITEENKSKYSVKNEGGIWRVRDETGQRVDVGAFSGFSTEEQARSALASAAHVDYGGVPNAPYINKTENWTDLGLKRALTEAVKNGYSKLVWTPGEEQAKRYGLSKHIGRVDYEHHPDLNSHDIVAYDPSGHPVSNHYDTRPEDIEKHLGKEIAEKILNGEGRTVRPNEKSELDGSTNTKRIIGLNTKIGGEGMEGYYDKLLPNRLIKLAREHDPEAALGQHDVSKNDRGEMMSLPGLAITPRMRESILKRGFKAYADGGEVDGAPQEPSLQNPAGGLSFPQDETAARLLTKNKRPPESGAPKNPRMTIRAPENSGLPDFTTGNINFEDWKKRHQSILSPAEIHNSAAWYKNIYGNFLSHYGDPDAAKKTMRAWLVAQQNISPAGAMNNVLMQQEQKRRGVPEHLWRAGGMPNPTSAARAVISDQPITGGVGQKISDFVDSAEDKPTRSWMGDHPNGGSPFVVDVHTARDTGMVDQELLNHLERLGYNKDDLAKTKIDLKGSPSEAAYENRAQFGRDLTDHLNKTGWMGRRDWTPAEIQAVGWMGMTKLTRNAEEDSESGLGRNLRRISYELSPGEGAPWGKKYKPAIDALNDSEKGALTQKMTQRAMEMASKISGIDVQKLVHGTGAWDKSQNLATVAHSLSTQQGADIAANAIGHMLQQTEVWHNRVKPVTSNPKGFAVDFTEKGSRNLADKDHLKDLWEKIMAADTSGFIRGYQPIVHPTGEVGIRALIDKGGLNVQKKLTEALSEGGDLHKMLSNLPYDITTQAHEAEITKAHNDWKEHPNGDAYISRLEQALGQDPRGILNSSRAQLEKELESYLDEAHARQGTTWRSPVSKKINIVLASGGAVNKAIGIAMTAQKRR